MAHAGASAGVALSAPVVGLPGLSSLYEVSGTVHVWETTITDLAGLDALRIVRGSFVFVMNDRMASFKGAGALKEVGGNVEVISQRYQSTFCVGRVAGVCPGPQTGLPTRPPAGTGCQRRVACHAPHLAPSCCARFATTEAPASKAACD